MISTTLFQRKVSWMTIKKPNGEALRTMNLLIVKVGLIKLIMEIQSRIRMIFMTLFV